MSKRSPLLTCALWIAVILLVAPVVTADSDLVLNLTKGASELTEWELWYDNPPNRKLMTLSNLAAQESQTYGPHVEFGWAEDGAVTFSSDNRNEHLGIKMIHEVPYPDGDVELVIQANVDVDPSLTPGPHVVAYFYDSGGRFLGQRGFYLGSTGGKYREFRFDIDPPSGTSDFRFGVFMGQTTGTVAFKQITIDPPLAPAFDQLQQYSTVHVEKTRATPGSLPQTIVNDANEPIIFTGAYHVPAFNLGPNSPIKNLISFYLTQGRRQLAFLGSYKPSITVKSWQEGEVVSIGPLQLDQRLLALAPGTYTITAKVVGDLWTREIAVGDVVVTEMDGPIIRLPAYIDPVKTRPFSQIGEGRVVESTLGPYLETGPNKYDRLAYLFETKSKGDLVKLTVTYPDDQTRTCEISVIPSHFGPAHYHTITAALGSGYLTGHQYPISGEITTQTYYFFAPSDKFALVFGTGEAQAPCGLISFSLEQVESVADVAAESAVSDGFLEDGYRKMGLYWEDPVLAPTHGFREQTDVAVYEGVIDRHIDYLKLTHQNTVMYPVVWYGGTVYRDSLEYGGYQVGGRSHPDDFHRMMAQRYSQEGIDFYPMIRNWSVPSARPFFIDPEKILHTPDAEYVNTVTREGRVIPSAGHSTPPMMNFLHPRVRDGFRNLTAELVDHIGHEPSVKGVVLFTASHSTHGFGTIDVGYDDFTVRLFAEESGLTLPELKGPISERFQQWYRWLRDHHWETWLSWRAQKQTEVYRDLAQVVAEKTDGGKLVILLREPKTLLDVVDDLGPYYYEHMAIDLEALAADERIVLIRKQTPLDYRWLHSERVKPAQYWDPIHQAEREGRLDELIGRDLDPNWLKPLVDKVQGTVMHERYFETFDAVFEAARLILPLDWEGEPNWRVTQPKPTGRYALEYYAKSMAVYDPMILWRGGYIIGLQGMEETLRDFAAVFTSLPAQPFATAAEHGGVVLRTSTYEGQHFAYLVNTTDLPVEVKMDLSSAGEITQLGLNQRTLTTDGVWTIQLDAFELVGWKSPTVSVQSLSTKSTQRSQSR